MNSNGSAYTITDLPDPANPQDAATKAYVDAAASAAKDNLGNHTATENLRVGNFTVSNDGDAGDGLAFEASGNASFGQDLTVNGNFFTPSDQRLKTNIETLSHALQNINQLRGVQFEYIDQKKYASGPKVGVIAQELQKVYPGMVSQGPDGFLKVDYTQLSAVLIEAVKEQQNQLKQQQEEIDQLKALLNNQQQQINDILKKLK
nr:tail fiber domain-containing protein [Pontibacter silvestris]